MANQKEVQGGLEWRVTVPAGASARLEHESGVCCGLWLGFLSLVSALKSKVLVFFNKAWKMGADDPRKAVHGIKVGLALSLVSLFYYTRPLYDGVGGTAMWAVMTVVVIFEFTVGGCLYKGLNRAIATTTAGTLAVGVHWIAIQMGKTAGPIILSVSVFILASAATFLRFLPTVKSRFDYGVTIFILTFSLVAVSSYRVDELLTLAEQRISTISIGISIALIVCVLVRPVWSGEDLHYLIIRNMEKLADSLEGCVEGYFETRDVGVAEEKAISHKSQSYKCVLNSKASEDSMANLARWEPPHGKFTFHHPWKQYLKVGVAARYCAYCIEALHGCINSEMVQAPESLKKHLSDICIMLSSASSKVLKESADSIKSMKRSRSIDFLIGEMNNAVHELHDSLRTRTNQQGSVQPSIGEENKQLQQQPILGDAYVSIMESMPLITIASLLVEISVRIEGVVEAVDRLAEMAGFSEADDDKPKHTGHDAETLDSIEGQEEHKVIQQVI